MDKLIARKPLDFSLLSSTPEFFYKQNIFFLDLSYTVSKLSEKAEEKNDYVNDKGISSDEI